MMALALLTGLTGDYPSAHATNPLKGTITKTSHMVKKDEVVPIIAMEIYRGGE
jgi:hypothetical protein